MTVIYSVESLQFTKQYSSAGNGNLIIQATLQTNDMIIEQCISIKHYMGTHLEYIDDQSPVYFVVKLRHTELKFVISKPVDSVRTYATDIAELMGF